MKLLSLTLDNFKGAKHFDFRPDGHSVIVKAANGVGKTTLEDAYWWLLTGKNTAGESKFDIFPYKNNGKPGEFNYVNVSVEGTFRDSDGQAFSLRRTLRPKFNKNRYEVKSGEVGTETEFAIEGVVKTKRDYDAFLLEHFKQEMFLRSLGKPSYFSDELNWSERRQILIQYFAPDLCDIDTIEAHTELEPLRDHIGAMVTVEDYAQQAKAQRRKINDRLREIPARIDEAEKSKPEIPADADPSTISKIALRRQELHNTVLALKSGEKTATLRRNIAEKEAKSAEARAVYIRDTTGGNENLQRQAAELRRQIQRTESKKAELVYNLSGERAFIDSAEPELAGLRKSIVDVHNEEFDSSDLICPTCGQTYPPERIEEIRAEFNTSKVKREEEIRHKGKSLKELLISAKQRAEKRAAEIAECDNRLKTLNRHLDELTASIVTPPAWETTTDARAYAVELNELREQLSQIDALTKKQLETTQMELDSVEAQYSKITSRTAIQEQIERIDARIQALQDEEKKLGIQLAQLDNRLLLTERFVQLQASDIEERINTAFDDVHWVLFDRQVNGEIKPCCRALFKDNSGTYASSAGTNTANQYIGGLHIIDGLSRAAGLRLPVWIDKAESCTNYENIENQVIRLQVSADHPEITVEVLS